MLAELESFNSPSFVDQLIEVFGEDDLEKAGLYPSASHAAWGKLSEEEVEKIIPTLFRSYFNPDGEDTFKLSARPYLKLVHDLLSNVKKALHIFTQPSLVMFSFPVNMLEASSI